MHVLCIQSRPINARLHQFVAQESLQQSLQLHQAANQAAVGGAVGKGPILPIDFTFCKAGDACIRGLA